MTSDHDNGRVAVIAGAFSGIDEATARALAAGGDRQADVLRFASDLRIPPTPARPNVTCGPPKPRSGVAAGTGAFREVLAEQAVDVLVGAALPRACRVAK
jgi:NAD(P)-dependent dehydrogenase (short-subunit alcohol dehydrogenase family)